MALQGKPTIVDDGFASRGPFTFSSLGELTFERIAALGLTFEEIGRRNVTFVNTVSGKSVSFTEARTSLDPDIHPDYVIHPSIGTQWAIGKWELWRGVPVGSAAHLDASPTSSVVLTSQIVAADTPLTTELTWPGARAIRRYLPDATKMTGGAWKPTLTSRTASAPDLSDWGALVGEPWVRVIDDASFMSRFSDMASLEKGHRITYKGLDGKLDGSAAHVVVLSGLFRVPAATGDLAVLQEASVPTVFVGPSAYPRVCLDSKGRLVVVMTRLAQASQWDAAKKKSIPIVKQSQSRAMSLESRVSSSAPAVIGVMWGVGVGGMSVCTVTSNKNLVTIKSSSAAMSATSWSFDDRVRSLLSIGSTSKWSGMSGAEMDLFEVTHVSVRSKAEATRANLEGLCRRLHSIYKSGGFDVA